MFPWRINRVPLADIAVFFSPPSSSRIQRLCPGRFGLVSRLSSLNKGLKLRYRSAVLPDLLFFSFSLRVLGPCAAAESL